MNDHNVLVTIGYIECPFTNVKKKNTTKSNIVPQLGGDEKIFSFDHSIREALMQGSSDLCLVAVDVSTVNVDVAFLQGSLHSIAHLSWLGQPRARLGK
jgi:hypothetical protein